MDDPARDVPEASRLARRAAQLGRYDALALARAGQALAYVVHEIDTASTLLDTSLSLNPNLAFAWWWRGWCWIWQGDPEAGIELAYRGLRLSPLDPFIAQMQMTLAHGHFFCGRHDEAVNWALKAVAGAPNSYAAYRILSAAAAFAGDDKRAREAAERLRQLGPGLRVSTVRHHLGPYGPDFLAKYEEGLRRAGFPE
jgi:adenylate cyclase